MVNIRKFVLYLKVCPARNFRNFSFIRDLIYSLFNLSLVCITLRLRFLAVFTEKRNVQCIINDARCPVTQAVLYFSLSRHRHHIITSFSVFSCRARCWDRFWWIVTMATSIGVVGGGTAWRHLAMAPSVRLDRAKANQVGRNDDCYSSLTTSTEVCCSFFSVVFSSCMKGQGNPSFSISNRPGVCVKHLPNACCWRGGGLCCQTWLQLLLFKIKV